VPTIPRLSIYIHKFNCSHDMVYETGQFVLHLLRTDQYDLIHQLGFVSGRERDKLAAIPHHTGHLGLPVLDDCLAWFECTVINTMDTGSSTCFLGDVGEVGRGTGDGGDVMTAAYFRAHLPPEWKSDYERLLTAAQEYAARHSRDIKRT
jgi:flavin reductase (DIM6/NTAB) family NADH-FMN oxidoreductase RutF